MRQQHPNRDRDRIAGHSYEHRNRRHNQLLGTRSAKPMSVRLRTRAGRTRTDSPIRSTIHRRDNVKRKQNLTLSWSESGTSARTRHANSSLAGHKDILLAYHHSISVYRCTCEFNKQNITHISFHHTPKIHIRNVVHKYKDSEHKPYEIFAFEKSISGWAAWNFFSA